MKNFSELHDYLNGKESQTIEYLASEYADYLNEKNSGILDALEMKREALNAEIQNIINKDFLIVYGSRNSNKRLVRKYVSSQYIRTRTVAASAAYLSFKHYENVFFMTMDKKTYEKMNLDENIRHLPGSPSTILELDATNRGRENDELVVYILGPDAAKVANFLDAENPKISCYESYKVDKTKPTAVNQSAIDLPLFYGDGRPRTYKECVDEGRLMIITRGQNTSTRSLINSDLWQNSGIVQSKFEKIKKWTNSEVFDKKFCFIKVGDYRRIQKYIKDETELPTWDEYLKKVFTKHPEFITQLFNLGITKRVENATSIFDTPSSSYYDAAVECTEKYFNNNLSEKQKTFIEDLKICYETRANSGNYNAADTAEVLNNHFHLGIKDPRDDANNIVKLGLETKYPWIKIISQYKCDEEACMKELLILVDRY